MRRILSLCCLLLALLAMPACANQADDQAEATADGSLETEDQKTLYALGLALAQNLSTFGLTEEELATVQAGLADGVTGAEPEVDLEQYGPKIQTMAQQRMMAAAEREREEGAKLLEEMATEEGAETLASGMVFIPVEEGTGESPEATDQVEVHYTGKLKDGTVFDSSRERGQAATFPLNQVIPCWTEGVQKMKVGGKAKLVCPPDLAYGDRPNPQIPAGSTLVFDVELLDVLDEAQAATPPPAAPATGQPVEQ